MIKQTARSCKHLLLFVLIIYLFFPTQGKAQGEVSTIQLSGLVIDGDSAYGVPGVHIYIERVGIGTTTNPVGFFTMPALIGDTVTISAVGYKKHNLVIPIINEAGFSVLVDLQTDTTFLPIIEVFPYPTKELFEEAFLALELPSNHYENMRKNLSTERLNALAASLPMDGSLNYKNYMNQHVSQTSNRFFSPTFSFLNPFAWAEFIRSVKKGDLKKKKDE